MSNDASAKLVTCIACPSERNRSAMPRWSNTSIVRACSPPARELSRSRLARRSTITTSTFANVNSAASIIPVGPPPAITTACSVMVTAAIMGHTPGLETSPPLAFNLEAERAFFSGRRLRRTRCLAADVLVRERADRCADDRADDPDPEVVPRAGRQGGTEGARRVHARAGHSTSYEDVEEDDAADGYGGTGADRAGIGRHGHDHEHQQRAEHRLDDQRRAGRDPDGVGTEIAGLVGPDREEQQPGERGSAQLGG